MILNIKSKFFRLRIHVIFLVLLICYCLRLPYLYSLLFKSFVSCILASEMMDPDLHQLMLDAEQQSSEISSMGSALPQLDRNLRQVCEASQTLWNKLSQTGSSEGIQA
jgi:hypothetical protein